MKRIKLETPNKNNFIGSWNIDDDELTEKIIAFFDKNHELHETGKLTGGRIDRNIKDSIDITIEPKHIKENDDYSIFKEYFNKLLLCYKDYQEHFNALEKFSKIHMGSFNIQKYLVGGHFKKPHFERDNLSNCHRLFAWMTYLNDVPSGGGETEFHYFDTKIKPEKGKTLIWPAEWTHQHCGHPTKKEQKYIITGWFYFPDRINE